MAAKAEDQTQCTTSVILLPMSDIEILGLSISDHYSSPVSFSIWNFSFPIKSTLHDVDTLARL